MLLVEVECFTKANIYRVLLIFDDWLDAIGIFLKAVILALTFALMGCAFLIKR
jgi:hypothetical protein